VACQGKIDDVRRHRFGLKMLGAVIEPVLCGPARSIGDQIYWPVFFPPFAGVLVPRARVFLKAKLKLALHPRPALSSEKRKSTNPGWRRQRQFQ